MEPYKSVNLQTIAKECYIGDVIHASSWRRGLDATIKAIRDDGVLMISPNFEGGSSTGVDKGRGIWLAKFSIHKEEWVNWQLIERREDVVITPILCNMCQKIVPQGMLYYAHDKHGFVCERCPEFVAGDSPRPINEVDYCQKCHTFPVLETGTLCTYCDTDLNNETLREKIIEQAKWQDKFGTNMCDACAGEGKKDCMCNGTGRATDAVYHLRDELFKSEERVDKLERLCRYQFLTLGYYGTPHNYDDKNIVHHPISGEVSSGIKFDGGEQAREAQGVAKKLGFTADEIRDWKGPFV